MPSTATRTDSGGVQSSGTNEIGVYYDSSSGSVYVAPVGNDNAIITAPNNCDSFFSVTECPGINGATSLTLDNFDTSNVTDMSGMFFNTSFTSLDLTGFDTSNVTTMNQMFTACFSLNTLNLSSFNTSKVINIGSMFQECSSLKTIYASDAFTTDSVLTHSNAFSSCSSLVGGNGTKYNSSITNKTYARIDKTGSPGYFTGATSTANVLDVTSLDGSTDAGINADTQDVSSVTVDSVTGTDASTDGSDVTESTDVTTDTTTDTTTGITSDTNASSVNTDGTSSDTTTSSETKEDVSKSDVTQVTSTSTGDSGE